MKRISMQALALGAWALGGTLLAQAQMAPGYTAAQAAAGAKAYEATCARCHGANLDDGEFGLPLRGRAFLDRWVGHQIGELFAHTKQAMPPDAIGSLSDSTIVELTAFVLSKNGIAAGAVELPGDLAALAALRLPGQPPADVRANGAGGGLSPGVTLPAWPAAANPLAAMTPVTDAMLQHPAAGDWLNWRRSYDAQGFSPLKQINKGNVAKLHTAWSLAMPPGPTEATPIVHEGVMFLHAYGDHVLAVNAATGDLLWHYARSLPKGQASLVQRSIALHDDRIYLTTSDVHVVALNAHTGAVIWDEALGDVKVWRVGSGPLVAQGVVMAGVVGRGPGGAYIAGFDAMTGKPLWHFDTIAHPGDPGDKTWNDVALDKRNGGSVWTPGSYDPELKLAFWGVAQTYDTATLQHPVNKPGITNDGLYLDSTVALDPATGKLAWHYQHLPNDQWDYDFAFERQILKLNVDGKEKKVVITGGKPAIFDVLEADTGKYVFSFDMGVQNVVKSIDPKTGLKVYNPDVYPDSKKKITVCPHAGGAKIWLPDAADPEAKVVYVPMVESCMDLLPVAEGERGSLSAGYRWVLRPRLDSDGKYGRLQAFDLKTRKTLWITRQRAPQSSGVLATAGGLVFAGALDRYFKAYDAANGKELWKTRLSDMPSAAPITYQVGDKQYVAMVVGFGGPQSSTFPVLVPEIRLAPTSSSGVFVFELP